MSNYDPLLYFLYDVDGNVRIGYSNDPIRQARRFPQKMDLEKSFFLNHHLSPGMECVIYREFHKEYDANYWGTTGGSQWYKPEAIPVIKEFIEDMFEDDVIVYESFDKFKGR